MYKNDIHLSKIISYKPMSLATMNTVNNNINILFSRKENHLNIHEIYLDIEFMVSYNGSIILETISGKTIEYVGNLLLYKLLTSISDEYESCFVRDQ